MRVSLHLIGKEVIRVQDTDTKRANIMRFGLMSIPPVAWAVAFGYLFLIANGFRLDWISEALIPSLIYAVVVGIVCVVVWYAYKMIVLKSK
jgi:hypothetical protein